ncbi:MAG: Na+/H+ antiporter NhaC family protein [Pirellulales bacterium]
MADAGWLAVLPTVVVVVAAIALRTTIPALVLGVLAGHALLDGPRFIDGAADSLHRQLATPAVASVMLVCGLFGGMIHLVVRVGGAGALSKLLTSRVQTARGALLVAWVMGLVIFIDDYLNALLIGHSLRPVTDRLGAPRERLAYVIDATAAPVCLLVPLSTWAIYVAGLLESTNVAKPGQGIDAYIGIIPWMFYGWFTVAIVPAVIMGWIPAWAAMAAADRRVAAGGPVAPPGWSSADDSGDDTGMDGGTLADFFVPVATLIAATTATGGNALYGVVWALAVVTVQQGIIRQRMTANDLAVGACRGIGSMVPALVTILLAFVLQDVNDRLGLTRLVVTGLAPLVAPAALPAVAFLALSLVTFATGSFWGTYAVALPIIVPLAHQLGADLPVTLGAVVSAGGFGSHACFFGDTTVLSSQASGCDSRAHAVSQLPYVLLAAALSTVAYGICGWIRS